MQYGGAQAAQGEERLVLYGTSACHLCELAQQLLDEVGQPGSEAHYQLVDISESDELFQRYGLRIPVLRRADGHELGWPFSARQLQRFLLDA